MLHIFTMNISSIDADDYRHLYDSADGYRQRKADRFLRQEDRLRCIVAGSLLRYAVFEALGKREFEIEATDLGKPQLKDIPDFHFNLSHSGQWVVLAYDKTPVGIDVEQIIWDSGKESIARKFFTGDEQEFVFGQSWQGRAERFFQIWTAKEAYLKYLGTGLRKALDSFSVLQIASPKKHHFQLPCGYSMTVWAESEEVTINQLTVERLLESIN